MAPIFSKADSTVKFVVKSIKYHDFDKDMSTATSIATDTAMYLLLSTSAVKLRQGVIANQGRNHSFWNVTFPIPCIEIVSLETREDELRYTFKSGCELERRSDILKGETLPKPTEYPLAGAHLINKVVQITLGLPSPAVWEQHSDIVLQVLQGAKFSLSKSEDNYVQLHRQAINQEAREEENCLVGGGCLVKCVAVADRILLGIWPREDRPFRLYRGGTLVIRGKHIFDPEKAKDSSIPGEKGYPEDWVATVSGYNPRSRSLIDAPLHAVLQNQVNIEQFHRMEEQQVEVHPMSNPVVQVRTLEATRRLYQHWGEENFDAMCREFESHDTIIPSERPKKLPLASMFLSTNPVVDTHEPVLTSPADLSTLVPKVWGLSEVQTQAATQLLTHSFSLVVGPPGTGKTRTIAAATMFVTQILKHESVASARLAVLVPTHAAGAAVMKQLSSAFEHFKYGAHQIVRLRSRADSEERLFANVTEKCDDIEHIIARASKQPDKYHEFLTGIGSLKTCGRVQNSLEEFDQQRRELIKNSLDAVRVVVTLPVNVKEMIRRGFNSEFVIFDEANFFRDPEIFSVLGQIKADARVLFVGDHKQFSPPTFTQPGQTAWAKSAFNRLIDKKYHQTYLNVSYRSHRIVYQPTSKAYYEGQVQLHRDWPILDFGINPQDPVVVRLGRKTWSLPGLSHFLHLAHVDGDTQQDPTGSTYHPQEAELGVSLAQSLMRRGAGDLLIMSPYRTQVAFVKTVWEREHPNCTVVPRIQTVDDSQGSEAEVVIVLTTRNFGVAGSLQSVKRTNVMLSRARTAQYVVGNWDWVKGKAFNKDSGRFYAYLEEADRVLDKQTEYAIAPSEEHGLPSWVYQDQPDWL